MRSGGQVAVNDKVDGSGAQPCDVMEVFPQGKLAHVLEDVLGFLDWVRLSAESGQELVSGALVFLHVTDTFGTCHVGANIGEPDMVGVEGAVSGRNGVLVTARLQVAWWR